MWTVVMETKVFPNLKKSNQIKGCMLKNHDFFAKNFQPDTQRIASLLK